MFVADDGYAFSYFDMSQVEARIVGWRYVIKQWMEDFERARLEGGFDAHRSLASVMFNMPYDDVPVEDWDENGKPTIRYTSKRCRHGLNYRMMPDELATQLGISYSQAEYLWHLYHRTNPEIQEGWKFDTELVRTKGVIYNAYGRRWMLMERYSDDAAKSVIAYYPQSTNGDHVTTVIRKCHNDKRWPRKHAAIRLNVHDMLMALHKDEHQLGCDVRGIMKEHAETPIPILGIDGITRELVVPCDLKASQPDEDNKHRWSNLVKTKEYTSYG